MTSFVIERLTLLAVALALGGAAGFSFLIAPTLLKRLPRAAASDALRALFPVYYLALTVAAIVGLALSGLSQPPRQIEGALLAGIAFAGLAARRVLLPRMEEARATAGPEPMRDPRFRRLHGASVALNLASIAALLATLLLLAEAR